MLANRRGHSEARSASPMPPQRVLANRSVNVPTLQSIVRRSATRQDRCHGRQPARQSTSSLRDQLQLVFGPQAARLGALHELTKLTPIAIIAEALGYATKTIEQHARASATTYTRYVASRHTTTSA